MNPSSDFTQVSRKQTVVNAIANYGQYAIGIGVGLFLQAYMIRRLGAGEYALWPLVQTCMGFVALIPVGIGSGAARFLSHALGKKDFQEVEEITSSLFFALLATAFVYLLCIVFLSFYFEKIFDIPPGAAGIGPWAMFLTGFSGAVAIPFGIFQGGLRAGQKFVILNAIRVALLLMRLALVVMAFSIWTPSLIWIGGIYLVLELLSGVAAFLAVRHVIPWSRVRLRSFRRQILWKVNSFSLLVLLITMASFLYWKTDNILINKLLDPALLTGYSVVANFVLYSNQLAGLGIAVLIPAATIICSQDDYPRIGRLLYRANRTIIPLAVLLQAFLIIFGKEILEAYLGKGYGEFAVLFPILAGGAIISVTQSAAGIVPQAFGKLHLVSLVTLFVAAANIALSIFFVVVLKWGVIGVAAGTSVVLILNKTLFWPWYTARLIGMPLRKYLYESYALPLANCLPVVVLMLGLSWLGMGNDMAGLFRVISLCGLVHATYMFFFGLDRKDRMAVRRFLAQVFRAN